MVKWRLVPVETNHPLMNVALDEAGMESVRATGVPIIRFYKWSPHATIIGYFQSMHDEVDVEKCKEMGVVFVRRLSGGGAVYNDDKMLTYSIIAPENMYPKGIHESYRVLCQPIIDALEMLGLKGEFKPINDILVNGKKISGNAQTRKGGVVLHHGTLLYTLDLRTMFSVLKVDKQKISDKTIKSVEERVTCLLNHKNVTESELLDALVKAFTKDKEFFIDKWSEKELERANELVETKYSKNEWMFMR